jgi:TonB family protein
MMTPDSDLELNLLREWREPVQPRRLAAAVIGSIAFHVIVVVGLVILPEVIPVREAPIVVADLRSSVPLYIPKELTQRDPNRGKVTKTLDVRSAPPPVPVPQAPRVRQPAPLPPPAPAIPVPTPEPTRIEPPKVESPKIEIAADPQPPPPSVGKTPQVAPPPEKPKLAFEKVGGGGVASSPNPNPNPALKIPKSLADETPRVSIQPPSGQPSPGAFVGDIDEALPVPGATPSSGPSRSNLQLLSDPKGVDFKPYLVQVLAAVRTNWLAVIPESARLGRRGRVLVQFIIDRRGGVPKLVIAESSGTAAFDRAAVAGISASNPFPPLPGGFQGTEIRLQLAFTYNVPSR